MQACRREGAPTAAAAPSTATTTLIAASCNRSASVLRVLPSWLAASAIDEIIVVDWSSHPPLSLPSEALRDPRLRLVRVVGETEWNLARAYNLAAQLASSEALFKVDADTWLSAEARARVPARGFLRGCRDLAPDENARHLNGVALLYRADLLAVKGWDERMRRYGFDDTDLYQRLSSALNVSSGCLSFSLMRHMAEAHAERGLTRVYHTLHRRATEGGLFPRWHEAPQKPTSWGLLQPEAAASDDKGGVVATESIAIGDHSGVNGNSSRRITESSHAVCQVQSLQRPPCFDELLSDSDELALAQQEALIVYSRRTLKPAAVARLHDSAELDTLMRVYDQMLNRQQQWLAVRPLRHLTNRVRVYCSAQAYAWQTSRRLLVVWEADEHTPARFDDLFETPAVLPAHSGGSPQQDSHVEVISTYHPGIFPPELWRRYDHTGSERVRRRNPIAEDDAGRSIFVSSASPLESVPNVDYERFEACM